MHAACTLHAHDVQAACTARGTQCAHLHVVSLAEQQHGLAAAPEAKRLEAGAALASLGTYGYSLGTYGYSLDTYGYSLEVYGLSFDMPPLPYTTTTGRVGPLGE